jgi:hypothetical protein
MLKATEPHYSYGKSSLERVNTAGWELRRKTEGKEKS